MKHAHHDMIVAWAADPSRTVERYSPVIGRWVRESCPAWHPYYQYRFKPAEPRFIIVNGMPVPEPVREPLKDVQMYWIANTMYLEPVSEFFIDTNYQRRWLSLGLIHLTREAAQAHIDAMLLPSRTDK